jgi:5-methylcytosine-specific restriction endonuclease McrBC GTP-binding regulatory subunit McrB
MLGFFNSIDNRFDAQPVLRFLAQFQKPWNEDDDYPGMADAMGLVLLDEMNLAHPELYFAEFLSKLELRRGMKESDVPFLPVKIGAGMEPYELPLGRNVLWAGTMNQDETTKSLSDKVLDRSIIIHFPRPTELKRRLKLLPLDSSNRGQILHRSSWFSWIEQGSHFTNEDVKPFKTFIEEMNASLAVAGRALGHRVWQSIEYYMANYPDVRAAGDDKSLKSKAMHTAFEDQLVQKVMPKLRGIDTRGKSRTECLDKIRGQLNLGIAGDGFNLDEDFEHALELGYGQFIWQSANYLKDDPDDYEDEGAPPSPKIDLDAMTTPEHLSEPKIDVPQEWVDYCGDRDIAKER